MNGRGRRRVSAYPKTCSSVPQQVQALRTSEPNDAICNACAGPSGGLYVRTKVLQCMNGHASARKVRQLNDLIDAIVPGLTIVRLEVSEVTPVAHRVIRQAMRALAAVRVDEVAASAGAVGVGQVAECVDVEAVLGAEQAAHEGADADLAAALAEGRREEDVPSHGIALGRGDDADERRLAAAVGHGGFGRRRGCGQERGERDERQEGAWARHWGWCVGAGGRADWARRGGWCLGAGDGTGGATAGGVGARIFIRRSGVTGRARKQRDGAGEQTRRRQLADPAKARGGSAEAQVEEPPGAEASGGAKRAARPRARAG